MHIALQQSSATTGLLFGSVRTGRPSKICQSYEYVGGQVLPYGRFGSDQVLRKPPTRFTLLARHRDLVALFGRDQVIEILGSLIDINLHPIH
jgi:hypothetical protein